MAVRKKRRKKDSLDHFKHTKNPRVRAEVLDYDYIKDLSKADQEYMAKFTSEYVTASFEIKESTGKLKKGSVHKNMEHVKKARDANNRRNNDVYGANRANGLLFDVQNASDTKDGWYITNPEYTEMELNAKLDNREDQEELTFIEFLECRGNMLESRQQELDIFFKDQVQYNSDDYYLLIIIYNSGEVTKGQIIKMSQNIKLLKKFIENSQLFKSNDDSADSY